MPEEVFTHVYTLFTIGLQQQVFPYPRFGRKTMIAMLKIKLLGVMVLMYVTSNAQIHPMMPYSEEFLQERREQIRQDNEFNRNEAGKHTNIHVNCLILNTSPMDIAFFSSKSWGILSVVRGKPGSGSETPLPFRIYIRRNGAIIHNPLYENPLYEVSISRVLAVAKPGDQLIIDPVNMEDYKAKRILKLID